MWFKSFLLLLAFTSVIASVQDDLQSCVEMVDVKELESMAKMEKSENLTVICPMMINFFSCLDDVVKTNLGLTLEQLAQIMQGTDIGKGAAIIVGVKGLFEDVCTEGSQLNIDYLADQECVSRIADPTGECEQSAVAAYEVYRGILENSVEVSGGDEDPDGDCMKLAYQFACVASIVHDECGRRAFNTFNTLMKRTGLFRYALCSEEGLEDLKTTFVDSLDMEDTERELFRLAFDLRKRRK